MPKEREYGYNAEGITKAAAAMIYELAEGVPQELWDARRQSGNTITLSFAITIQPLPIKDAS